MFDSFDWRFRLIQSAPGENGVNVEIALRIPDIIVAASAGYSECFTMFKFPFHWFNILSDSEGFCDKGPEHPFGVKFDATLGAKLGLQGYTEVNGDRDVFLDLTIYEAPELYTFPELCLDFDDQTPGPCVHDQSIPSDPIDAYPPGGYIESEDEEAGVSKRSVALVKRDENSAAPGRERKPYYLACDKKKDFSIRPQKYQSPTDLRQKKGVPIMKPGMSCIKSESETCPADEWTMEPLPEDATDDERAIVTEAGWACKSILFITYLV